ncbi:unnamed protein product [Parajaminaea phylloscopi]
MPFFRRSSNVPKDSNAGLKLRRTDSLVTPAAKSVKRSTKTAVDPLESQPDLPHLPFKRAKNGKKVVKPAVPVEAPPEVPRLPFKRTRGDAPGRQPETVRRNGNGFEGPFTATKDSRLGSDTASDRTIGRVLKPKRSIFQRLSKQNSDDGSNRRRESLSMAHSRRVPSRDLTDAEMEMELSKLSQFAASFVEQRATAPQHGRGIKRHTSSPRIGLGIEMDSNDSSGAVVHVPAHTNTSDRLKSTPSLASLARPLVPKIPEELRMDRQSFLRLPAGLRGMPFMDDDTFAVLSQSDVSTPAKETQGQPYFADDQDERTNGGQHHHHQQQQQQQQRQQYQHQNQQYSDDDGGLRTAPSSPIPQRAQGEQLNTADEVNGKPSHPNGSAHSRSAARKDQFPDSGAISADDLQRDVHLYNSQVRRACDRLFDAVSTSNNNAQLSQDAPFPPELQKLGLDPTMRPQECHDSLRELLLHVCHCHLLRETQATLATADLKARDTAEAVHELIKEHAPLSVLAKHRAHQAALCLTLLRIGPGMHALVHSLTMTGLYTLLGCLLLFASGSDGAQAVDSQHDLLQSARDGLESICARARGVYLTADGSVGVDQAALARGLYEVRMASSPSPPPSSSSDSPSAARSVPEYIGADFGKDVGGGKSSTSVLTQQLGLVSVTASAQASDVDAMAMTYHQVFSGGGAGKRLYDILVKPTGVDLRARMASAAARTRRKEGERRAG